MKITAILIAAGLSSRMKGPNKLLQDIGGKTLIQHTCEQLDNSDVDEVIVVTGRDADLVQLSIINYQLSITKFVYNPNFEMGMTTSIQAGLIEAVNTDAVMICLSDMPELMTQGYNELVMAFEKDGGKDKILAPFRHGQKGNPVIFGSAYFTQMAEHKELNGCSAIVKAHNEHLVKFETDSEAYFFDIDTPESLESYRSRAK